MNVIGSFDFGRVIKTLLPGLVILAAISALIDSAITLSRGTPLIAPWAAANTAIAGVLAAPLAVTLGLLSNTLFFYLLHERLIERALRSSYPDLCKAEVEFKKAVVTEKINALPIACQSEALETAIDAGALLLPDMNLSALAITRKGFWFYMEFQLNMALAIVFAWPAIVFTTFVARADLGLATQEWIIASVVLSTLFVCLLLMLIGAARTNHYCYRRRMLALRVAALLKGLKKIPKDEGK